MFQDLDPGFTLEGVRQLRQIASHGDTVASTLLGQLYTKGLYGGLTSSQAMAYTQQLFQTSKPLMKSRPLTEPGTPDESSRYSISQQALELLHQETHVYYFLNS